MSHAILLLALCASLGAFQEERPGPIDAYMANYASVQADVEFEFTAGKADYGRVRHGELLKASGFEFVPERFKTLVGRWSSDGESERLRCEPLVKDIHEYPRWGPGYLHYVSPFDLLFNSQKAAFISNVRDIIHLGDTDAHPSLEFGKTPFFRWSSESLPNVIRKVFAGVAPILTRQSLYGYSVEVEVYERDTPEQWSRFEVAYDPSIGYLPRLTRKLISIDPAKSTVQVWENWLITARRCLKSGGFVPTEWYEFLLTFRNFRSNYPRYGSDTVFDAAGLNQVHVGHYAVKKFTERSRPVAFDDIGGVRLIGSFGGSAVPVQKGLREMTLSQISSIASRSNPRGRNTAILQAMQKSIDREDASRFDRRENTESPIGRFVLFGVLGTVIILGAYYWRSRLHVLLLGALALVVLGCNDGRKPILLLRASLDKTKVIVARKSAPIDLHLKVRNDGSIPLRILRVDGGCSCRRVEQSTLPFLLKVGGEISLPVTAQVDPQFSPRPLTFSFDTDHGVLGASVKLLAVPSHHVEPESIANTNLIEDQAWDFELKHTQVAKDRVFDESALLKLPENFSIVDVQRTLEVPELEGFPGVFQRDVLYRIKDNNLRLGLSRRTIKLVDKNEVGLLEIPVVTRRSPYITSAPDRVYLADRPFRVFLRCPDTLIEFTTVISAPVGVKAFVSSPQEITVVSLPETKTVNGLLRVGTTSPDHPPLEIPVVRYSSELSTISGPE